MTRTQPLKTLATMDNLEKIQGFVHEQFSQADCPPAMMMRLDLIVEEIAVNIMSYAYDHDKPGDMQIECSFSELSSNETEFVLVFMDWGVPFDPLAAPKTEIETDLDASTPGGLGIFLTIKIASNIAYHHDGSANILTVSLICPNG